MTSPTVTLQEVFTEYSPQCYNSLVLEVGDAPCFKHQRCAKQSYINKCRNITLPKVTLQRVTSANVFVLIWCQCHNLYNFGELASVDFY